MRLRIHSGKLAIWAYIELISQDVNPKDRKYKEIQWRIRGPDGEVQVYLANVPIRKNRAS